jgi:hypothetical protein
MENSVSVNKIIVSTISQIFEVPELYEKFKKLKTIEEMYAFATGIRGGFSTEKFEKFIFEIVQRHQEYRCNNSLQNDILTEICGGSKFFEKYDKKITAVGLSSLFLAVPLSKTFANYGASSEFSCREKKMKTDLREILR